MTTIKTFHSAKELLSAFPDALYTTMRTVRTSKNSVGLLFIEEHAQRLGILREELEKVWRQIAKDCIADERITVVKGARGEYLVTKELIDVAEMDRLRATGCKVHLVEHTRINPSTKSTKWVQERAKLTLKVKDAEEVLLVNESGEITEGCTSNVFACYDDPNVWYTAPDSIVLPGTMRKAVIQAMGEIGLELNFNAPKKNQIVSAFICSTSRFVIPIGYLDDHLLQLPFITNSLMKALCASVLPRYTTE